VDPAQKRILIDLSRAYRDKMRHAAAHMHEMCELSDIPDPDAVGAIFAATLYFVVEIVDKTTAMSAEDFAATCAEALQERRAENRRARRK